MNRKNFILLLFVFIASVTLITINFYTIKILSGVRTYINGESEYSKGQKDAVVYLSTYIQTEDPCYWQCFTESIKTPKGDNIARKYMLNKGSNAEITNGFLAGMNHPDDIPDMIWLFKTFQSVPFMNSAIKIWIEAEPLINELDSLGNVTHQKIANKSLTAVSRQMTIIRINDISTALSKKESAFSHVLGNAARDINLYLCLANVICILLIIGNVSFYVARMLNDLHRSKEILETKNTELINVSKELDTFVYSLSHDLRSPITSVKGLITITRMENNPRQTNDYLDLMEDVIDKQDSFIKEIISFFKNKRSTVSYSRFSLSELINCVIANNKFSPLAQDITITCDLKTDIVFTDELRMKMILNNLVSNAIKYSDQSKPERTIHITTYTADNKISIAVADNGIGIEKEHFLKIFNMFFVTSNDNRGTGLGLYILKQNVEKLGGNVHVESEIKKGTRFTVSIPSIA